MAKITIAGDAVVVTSALKLEDIKTVEKYRPQALVLMEEEEPIFAICTTKGAGSINENGASFGRETHDANKFASITMIDIAGKSSEEIKEKVADELGSAIINLNKLEAALPAVLEEIAADKALVMSNITIAQ